MEKAGNSNNNRKYAPRKYGKICLKKNKQQKQQPKKEKMEEKWKKIRETQSLVSLNEEKIMNSNSDYHKTIHNKLFNILFCRSHTFAQKN